MCIPFWRSQGLKNGKKMMTAFGLLTLLFRLAEDVLCVCVCILLDLQWSGAESLSRGCNRACIKSVIE